MHVRSHDLPALVRPDSRSYTSHMLLRCGPLTLDLSRPAVMGVLNVTPDSFSDGGRFRDAGAAIAHGRRMIDEGAALIDVGGESARPGAADVPVAEELARVVPVIAALARAAPATVISVDTSKPEVMAAALDAGATMINDIRALGMPGALALVAGDARAPAVCLMHMQGEPRTMQTHPRYSDVVGEVRDFLRVRVNACVAAGIKKERLVVDPGFGFGKTLQHNLDLLRRLGELAPEDVPLLAGLSRKSMIKALGVEETDRLPASLALAVLAVVAGARIVRAHDVRATRDAVRVAGAVYSRAAA